MSKIVDKDVTQGTKPVIQDVDVPQNVVDLFKEDAKTFDENGVDLVEVQQNLYKRQEITTQEDADVKKSLVINKLDPTQYTPTNDIAAAIDVERKELFNMLNGAYANIDFNFLGYIPNSRFATFNKIIKSCLANNKPLSHCDYQLFQKMWMYTPQKNKMLDFINANVGVSKKLPMMSTNTYPYSCTLNSQGDYVLGIKARNPLYIELEEGHKTYEGQPGFDVKHRTLAYEMESGGVTNSKHASVKRAAARIVRSALIELDTLKARRGHIYDPAQVELQKLRKALNSGKVDTDTITNLMSDSKFREIKRNLYLQSVFDPFRYRARVPDLSPIPTALVSVTKSYTLTSDTLGGVLFQFIPRFNDRTYSSLITTDPTGAESAASTPSMVAVNISEAIPQNLYNKYRVVSFGVKLTPITASDEASGFACVSYLPIPVTPAYTIANNYAIDDITPSDIDNGTFRDAAAMNAQTSLSTIGFQRDAEFSSINSSVLDGAIKGYIMGAKPGTAVARLELVYNVEATVDVDAKDYIPSQSLDVPDATEYYKQRHAVIKAIDKGVKPESQLKKESKIDNMIVPLDDEEEANWISRIADNTYSSFVEAVQGEGLIGSTLHNAIELLPGGRFVTKILEKRNTYPSVTQDISLDDLPSIEHFDRSLSKSDVQLLLQ